MSFVDVNIKHEQVKFTISVYPKQTFCGIYTHFDSFLPYTQKISMIHTLLYRFFRICSDWTKFHLELVQLMGVFKGNDNPEDFINKIVVKRFWITNIEYKKSDKKPLF